MPQLNANGIGLEYDTFGDASDPALLLVMGLGMQMIAWDPAFCQLLVDRGFHVIRFDNRDAGLSQGFEDSPRVDMAAVMAGDHTSAPYRLWDMAADAAGLLTALGIDKAHVVGASMGGMIVQEMAIRHADQLLSVCSIMSTTGDRSVGSSTPEATAALRRPTPATREEAVEASIQRSRVIGSPSFPFDEQRIRTAAKAAYDRAVRPDGFVRQFVAVMSSGDRTEALHKVELPVQVIHGEDDPLINVTGGRATAAAIPDARLLVIPGMGHDLPPAAWPTIVDAIVDNAARSADA
jgi:pimeloyl-ACP methyl ester carboxylesterase